MKELELESDLFIGKSNIAKLDAELDKIVQELTSDRGDSHGYAHLKRISRYAIGLARMMSDDALMGPRPSPGPVRAYGIVSDDYVTSYILTVAWIHDLLDHKYPDDYKRNLTAISDFIQAKTNLDLKLVLAIVERISFSREKNLGDADWKDSIGEYGILVRNIVSDADKLDAIGKGGLIRCMDYLKETYPSADRSELVGRLKQHAEDKLLKIKDHYIRTEEARAFAQVLHDEMEVELTLF